MARIEQSIDVEVPVRAAYDKWTRFEEFPTFMDGVESVERTGERMLHWRASVGGMMEEWDAEIQEQVPDHHIIWRSVSGAENAGLVRFDAVGPSRTRVNLRMSYTPENLAARVGDALGFMTRRVRGDLERFREDVERNGASGRGDRDALANRNAPEGYTRGRPATGG